jgi:hypothetical protein
LDQLLDDATARRAVMPNKRCTSIDRHDSPAVRELYISVGREALVKSAASFPDVL